MPSQPVVNECGHLMQFAFAQLISEWSHSVAAVGDLFIDLVFGVKFEIALAQAWYPCAVLEQFPVGLRPVADGTVLAKEGRLV